MKPKNNGLVTMVDDKQNESGFSCMKLIKFLSVRPKYDDWAAWHEAHIMASKGKCPFLLRCSIYKKTIRNKELYEQRKTNERI